MSSRRAIFSMEQPGVVAGNFALSFSLNLLSIFVHISGSIRPITLIWVSLERSFPFGEVEYRWCQFWSKKMTSELEERPRLFTTGYSRHRRHRSQWVKENMVSIDMCGTKEQGFLAVLVINRVSIFPFCSQRLWFSTLVFNWIGYASYVNKSPSQLMFRATVPAATVIKRVAKITEFGHK